METEAPRTAGDDSDFAIEGEDGVKVVETDLFFGGHLDLAG
jgi:hypothetical protein